MTEKNQDQQADDNLPLKCGHNGEVVVDELALARKILGRLDRIAEALELQNELYRNTHRSDLL